MTDRQALATELNALMAGERCSLLRHLDEATPYLDAKTYPIWHEITKAAAPTRDHMQRLADLFERYDLPARAGTFDPIVANYHFSDLPFLLPLLIKELDIRVQAYARAAAMADNEQALRDQLDTLLQENQQILDQLQMAQQKLSA